MTAARSHSTDPATEIADWMRQGMMLWLSPWQRLLESAERSRSSDGCAEDDPCTDPCGNDPCCDPCRCCICDADLVIHARPGERRVVPIVIDNERHRSREVHVSLGNWATREGDAGPVSADLSAKDLSIPACGSASFELTVTVARSDETNRPTGTGCTVYYAELRLSGCRNRPYVVAVAVSSLDCDPIELHCGCGCC